MLYRYTLQGKNHNITTTFGEYFFASSQYCLDIFFWSFPRRVGGLESNLEIRLESMDAHGWTRDIPDSWNLQVASRWLHGYVNHMTYDIANGKWICPPQNGWNSVISHMKEESHLPNGFREMLVFHLGVLWRCTSLDNLPIFKELTMLWPENSFHHPKSRSKRCWVVDKNPLPKQEIL